MHNSGAPRGEIANVYLKLGCRHCERSEAIHGRSKKEVWIAHMGDVCVKDEQSPFCSTAATSSSRPRAVQDGARRSSQGRPFRAAAQRLGLELSEHVILLGPSGEIGAPGVGGSVRASAILSVAIQGSSRFSDLGCSHGECVCQGWTVTFLFDCGHLFVPTAGFAG